MRSKTNSSNIKRKIVLGLGNTLNCDEGMGVHYLKALETHLKELHSSESLDEDSNESQIEFLDGGVLGLNLLPWVEEASHLLVLDAINARKEPGSIIELSRNEIPLYTGIKLSDHQITFQEVLGLAQFRGLLPEHLHLIGAQPVNLSIGIDLSPEIEATIPKIIDRAEEILREWKLIE